MCWIRVVSWVLRSNAFSPPNSLRQIDCIVSIANLQSTIPPWLPTRIYVRYSKQTKYFLLFTDQDQFGYSPFASVTAKGINVMTRYHCICIRRCGVQMFGIYWIHIPYSSRYDTDAPQHQWGMQWQTMYNWEHILTGPYLTKGKILESKFKWTPSKKPHELVSILLFPIAKITANIR